MAIYHERNIYDDKIATFKEYMNIFINQEEIFSYKLISDSNGYFTGCIWKTSIIRYKFERFSYFVSIDTINQGINKWLWPYPAITIYNEIELEWVVCASIMFVESNEVY